MASGPCETGTHFPLESCYLYILYYLYNIYNKFSSAKIGMMVHEPLSEPPNPDPLAHHGWAGL